MSTPPFIGPPEQNTAGTLVRMAAKIIPGVILSQFGNIENTVKPVGIDDRFSSISDQLA